MIQLTGKTFLVTGILSDKSIAFAIASALHQAGARLVLTYVDERHVDRIQRLCAPWQPQLILQCDVTIQAHIDSLATQLLAHQLRLDGFVHSMAFATRECLQGDYLSGLTRKDFMQSMDISVYSLSALCQSLRHLFNTGASIITLSYLGAQRALPHYNVMGVAKAALESSVRYLAADLGKDEIRINAVSAGPIKTLAASGISGFKESLKQVTQNSALKKTLRADEVASVACFLLSSHASAVTGSVVYVDNGYHIMSGGGACAESG